MKQFTLGNFTLDQFADYLNGDNSYFVGIEGGELLLCGRHNLSKTLNVHFPLTITGDEATIVGNGLELFAVNISASNAVVRNIQLEQCKFGIEVDALGGCVENVTIADVVMNGGSALVEVGSSVSNSTLRNIHIERCCANVMTSEWEENPLDNVSLPYYIAGARYKQGSMLTNCVLEDIYMDNCQKLGFSGVAVSVATGIAAYVKFANMQASYSDIVVRNVNITNNHFDTCWDALVSIIAQFLNSSNCSIEGINISGNYGEHGIASLYMFAGRPMLGGCDGAKVSDVVIDNNHFVRSVSDVGEPVRGIWISSSRGDALFGAAPVEILSQPICNNSVSNVEISNNKLEGAGITLTGTYALGDNGVVLKNNKVDSVDIHHNTILAAEIAFIIDGAQAEGRLYDWDFGYPKHDKQWGEQIDDHSVVTYTMTDNRVENITVTNNTIEGYRYRVVASGFNGHGHGVVTNNKVCGNIVFENNSFGVGENHIHVADFVADDFVRDGGGNKVDIDKESIFK